MGRGSHTPARDRGSTFVWDSLGPRFASYLGPHEPTAATRNPPAHTRRPGVARSVRARRGVRGRCPRRGGPEGRGARPSPSPRRRTRRSRTTWSGRRSSRASWAPKTALRDRARLIGQVALADIPAGSVLQEGMLGRAARARDRRARDRDPRRRRDRRRRQDQPGSHRRHRRHLRRQRPGGRRRPSPTSSSPARGSSTSASPELKGGNAASRSRRRPASKVVPVTFALEPKEALTVTYAESFAAEVRLALLRPGRGVRSCKKKRARVPSGRRPSASEPAAPDRESPTPISRRHAAALASEASDLEVVERVSEPGGARARRCAGSTSTSWRSTTRSATVPVMEHRARDRGELPRGRDGAARAPSPAGADARGDAGRHPRRRRAAALARAARVQRARRRPVVARAARAGLGEETAVGALARRPDRASPAPRAASAPPPSRSHLALAAARNAPGRPVCLRRLRPPEGRHRALLDTPYRRSVVDLVEVADEISVRHLQETLFTHRERRAPAARARRRASARGGRLDASRATCSAPVRARTSR